MTARRSRSSKGTLSPLGEARYLIRRREAAIRVVMTARFGEAMTDRFLEAATRAQLDEIRSDTRKLSKRGQPYAPPGSAVVSFAPEPVRDEESAPVRHMALLLLTVLELLEPGGTRVASRGLYLGSPYAAKPNGLAGRLGRSVRELERYLAVFRSAGILDVWQPPSSSGVPKSIKGHCYNVYELAGPMPRELAETLAAWSAAHKRTRRAESQRAAVAEAPRATPHGAATAARFLERFPPPS